jgi:hypothetical protein
VVAPKVFNVDRQSFRTSVLAMNQWSLALDGPSGLLSALGSGETQFVLGAEEAADVLTITVRNGWSGVCDQSSTAIPGLL